MTNYIVSAIIVTRAQPNIGWAKTQFGEDLLLPNPGNIYLLLSKKAERNTIMNKKHVLSLLLCLLLVLSMFMTACTENETNDENKPPVSDSQAIVDDISSLNFSAIIEEISKTANTTYDELLADYALEGNISLGTEGQTMNGYFGIKDSVIQVESEMAGESAMEMFALFSGNNIIALTPSYGGYTISVESGEDSSNEISQYLTNDVLAILKEFRFPAITESQFTKEGDAYIVSDEYMDAVATKILDTAIGIMKAAGLPEDAVPSDSEYDEIANSVKETIDALGLKIGFTVENERISGIVISINGQISKIAEALDSDVSEDEDGTITADFKISFVPDTFVVKYMKVAFDMQSESQVISLNTEVSVTLDNQNLPVGTNVSFTYTAPAYDYDYIEYGEPDEYGCFNYADINIDGSITVNASVLLDLSKLSAAEKASVIDATVTYATVYSSYTVEIYDENANEYVEISPSSIGITVDLAERAYSGEYSLKVNTTGKNEIDFSFSADTNGEKMTYSGNASVDPDSADNFGTLPEDIAAIKNDAKFIDKYNSAMEVGYELEAHLSSAYDSPLFGMVSDAFDVGFIHYDEESGLYIFFDSIFGSPEIRTNAPEDIECIGISIDPISGEIVFDKE